jgi:hypothetical protein
VARAPKADAEAVDVVSEKTPAALAAMEHLEMRITEFASFVQAELHHFEDGVDGVCKLVADRLKSLL